MKSLLLSLFMMSSWGSQASIDSSQPVAKAAALGVIAQVPRSKFDQKYQTFLKSQWQNCTSCEVLNLTPYNEKGELNRAALAQSVEKAAGQVPILYITWNEVVTADNQAFLAALKSAVKNGVVVVGPVGEPAPEKRGSALNRTMLGQVPDAVIIAQMDEKESFPQRSFYGPEILTALKTPKDSVSLGDPAMVLAARLTREWPKKSQSEWINHFRARKTLSKRLWPGMDELFGR